MRHSELEHLLRAAGELCGEKEFFLIGSQAILGAFPNAPGELLVSVEADIYPKNNPAASDVIDRVPRIRISGAHAKEKLRNMQIECQNYAYTYGVDKPEADAWKWPG